MIFLIKKIFMVVLALILAVGPAIAEDKELGIFEDTSAKDISTALSVPAFVGGTYIYQQGVTNREIALRTIWQNTEVYIKHTIREFEKETGPNGGHSAFKRVAGYFNQDQADDRSYGSNQILKRAERGVLQRVGGRALALLSGLNILSAGNLFTGTLGIDGNAKIFKGNMPMKSSAPLLSDVIEAGRAKKSGE